MPKRVHDCVNKILRDKSFYPDNGDRESIAWAICNKNIEKRDKRDRHHKHALLKISHELDSLGFYKDADIVMGFLNGHN